ncbi:hypothetical protein STENM223S_09391 [Streptomyces tendae]
MQQPDHRPGDEQLARGIGHDRHTGRDRMPEPVRTDHRQGAVRCGHGGQVAAHPLGTLPSAAADGVQDAQGVRGVQRLADRAAHVGLQGVAVPAVRVAVRVERGFHRVGIPAAEVVREQPLLQYARGEPHEALRARER